jgi:hypothetical protein
VHPKSQDTNGSETIRFILGLALGVSLGLLYAPAREETREQLFNKARNYAKVPQEKLADTIEAKKQKVSEMAGQLGRKAAESAVDNVTEKLRDNERSA